MRPRDNQACASVSEHDGIGRSVDLLAITVCSGYAKGTPKPMGEKSSSCFLLPPSLDRRISLGVVQ